MSKGVLFKSVVAISCKCPVPSALPWNMSIHCFTDNWLDLSTSDYCWMVVLQEVQLFWIECKYFFSSLMHDAEHSRYWRLQRLRIITTRHFNHIKTPTYMIYILSAIVIVILVILAIMQLIIIRIKSMWNSLAIYLSALTLSIIVTFIVQFHIYF